MNLRLCLTDITDNEGNFNVNAVLVKVDQLIMDGIFFTKFLNLHFLI